MKVLANFQIKLFKKENFALCDPRPDATKLGDFDLLKIYLIDSNVSNFKNCKKC